MTKRETRDWSKEITGVMEYHRKKGRYVAKKVGIKRNL